MDVSQHRITGPNTTPDSGSTNPASFGPPLDSSRCAALHNALVQRAALSSSRDVGNIKGRTWWEQFGSEIESPETKLHPAVIDFLKLAWYSWENGIETSIPDAPVHLFCGVKGLPPPEQMFGNGVAEAYAGMDTLDVDDEDGDSEMTDYSDDELPPPESTSPADQGERASSQDEPLDLDRYGFISLYSTISKLSDSQAPLGIVLDQKHHKAVLISNKANIDDALTPFRAWRPLEVILDLWHGIIDYGKVAMKDGEWFMRPLAPDDLINTLRAWHEIIDDIESRMPADANFQTDGTEHLLDHETAQALDLSSFRACRFNQSKPSAKGGYLSISRTAIIALSGLKASLQHKCDTPSAANIPKVDLSDPESERLFPFANSINPESSFAPGLYLSCTGSETFPYADSFRLVHPYQLGANRCARTSSLTLIEDRYAELYQLGYDEIGGGSGSHDAQLASLFDRWRGRLKEAHSTSYTRGWGVGKDGVDGIEDNGEEKGIEIFRNADEGAIWATYQLPGPLILNTQRCAVEAARRVGSVAAQ